MSAPDKPAPTPLLTRHNITVLLVDDQAIVAEAVRRMLAGESDIVFHYCGDPTKAIQQASELSPTVILQDLVMPDIDGLTLVKFFRANARTRDIPLIVLSTKEEATTKAQAFANGANDYLVKLPDKIELIARIRYHSKGYINLLERNEAYSKLLESQQQLAEEVAQAANYVRSLLPAPLKGEIEVEWKFQPSTQLGGDSFGYHWLDADHFAIYLLDVSGHGVGASLMSVSAMNVLSGQTLPNTDFRNPSQVLHNLNNIFQMDRHNEKYFSIWYGIYRKSLRQLTHAGAGHPGPLLFTGPSRESATVKELNAQDPAVGFMPDYDFSSDVCGLDAYARLYLFSDGVFEIHKPDGSMWRYGDFKDYMASLAPDESAPADRLLEHVRQLHGSETLEDDFSMVQVTFK